MKALKKSLALLLALLLTLAMGTTAFAAGETYTITIENDAAGHIYEAYQIFAGDLSTNDDGKTVLSNIVWGSGITDAGKTALLSFGKAEGEEAFEDAAALAKSLTTTAQAQAFAKEAAKYLAAHTDSSTQSEGKYTISGLAAGYYLVKDKDNTLINEDDFYTAYIMEVVKDVTAQPKGDKPELKKEIKHNEKGTWEVVGDNQIGDTVEFRTVTTIPDTSAYTEYNYIIHDTMSVGLTSNVKSAADVQILVNDTGNALSADYYTVTANGNSFDLKINVLKAIADGKMTDGDELYTYYSGVLNEDARIYNEGSQNNEAYLEYSNNPNDTTGKGQTEKSKVYEWTFKMQVNKVNEEKEELTGAKFVLSKAGTLKVADMACNEDGVPTATTDLIALVKEVDGTYHIATDAEIADSRVVKVYDIDAGSPVIKGLDDNTDYYLYETKAPTGYNLLDGPVQFKITAEYTTDGSALLENYPTVKVGTAEASTNLSTNVINKEGSVLPSTGGMGTTLFYILGGLLVVGAGVVLITRKRMSKSEN